MKTHLLLMLSLVAATAHAELTMKATPQQGKVEFEAVGKPSLLKIKGLGEGAVADLKVNDGKISGEIRFNLNSLKTGIDLRDEHMKNKYLQTEKYPQAILSLKEVALSNDWSLQKTAINEKPFAGTLDLHGEKKPISGSFSIASDKLDGSAQFEIRLSDFKVDLPEYLGVKVADVVKVKVSFNEMKASETTAPPAATGRKK